MLRRTAPSLAVGVAALVTLTACSSNTTTAAPASASSAATTTTTSAALSATPSKPVPADQVVDVVKASLDQSTAVHAHGKFTQDSVTVTVDVQANKGGTASGKVNIAGTDISFIAANGTTYIQLTKAIVEHQGIAAGSPTEAKMLQKYVPATSKLVSDVAAPVVELGSYKTAVTGSLSGVVKLTADGSSQVNGELADGYTDTDGSKLFIENQAPHRLLRLVGSQKNPGQIDFDWGNEVPIAAPPAAEIYTGPGA